MFVFGKLWPVAQVCAKLDSASVLHNRFHLKTFVFPAVKISFTNSISLTTSGYFLIIQLISALSEPLPQNKNIKKSQTNDS